MPAQLSRFTIRPTNANDWQNVRALRLEMLRHTHRIWRDGSGCLRHYGASAEGARHSSLIPAGSSLRSPTKSLRHAVSTVDGANACRMMGLHSTGH